MSAVRAGIAGLLATALAVATTELVAGLLPGRNSVFVAVGDAVIRLTPGGVVRFAIATFGSNNRAVLLGAMTLGMAVAGVAIGIVAARRPPVGDAGITAFAVVGALVAITDPLITPSTAVVAPGAGALVGVVALRGLLAATFRPDARDETAAPGSRRAFIGAAGSVAAGAAAFAVGGRWLQQRPTPAAAPAAAASELPPPPAPLPEPAAGTMFDVPGLSELITPNTDFFRIDTAFSVPRVAAETHTIRVSGLVDHPYELTYAELLDLVDTEADVTLSCVSNEVGGRLVGTARWLGVRLDALLERAGVQPGATQVVGRSVDGWTSGFPIEAAGDGRTALVAVGMNGEPLPAEHGFPARLVIAGLYGYVSNTKWLEEIALTTFEAHAAYWIPRGWALRGPIKTQSRIDVPGRNSEVSAGTVAVAGVAWADEHGISAVEVAVDDGPWEPATLSDELAPSTWRQWKLAWNATPGTHELRVRAFDADGRPQTAESSPPAPDGATGHHRIRVSVV